MKLRFFMRYETDKMTDRSCQSGFSLLELCLALALFSVFIVAITGFFTTFQRRTATQQVVSDVVQQIRSALVFMAEDIKLAGADPSESKRFNVVTATDTEFTFDFDTPDPDPSAVPRFDGLLNTNPLNAAERVTYRFLNGNLQKILNLGLITSPAPEVENILQSVDFANSRFQYFDEDTNIIPDANGDGAVDKPEDIRSVQIDLTVKEKSGRDAPVSKSFTSRVMCRNLTFNAQRR